MRTLVRVIGGFLMAFALVGVAVEIDNARTGKDRDKVGVGIAMIFIFGGGGAALWRASSRIGMAASGPRSTTVIRAAQKHAGRITAAEVAADTTLTFEEAKAELDRLSKAGACEIVVGDAGILVYRFPEFENAANKKDIV
jgi:hypothetical protein